MNKIIITLLMIATFIVGCGNTIKKVNKVFEKTQQTRELISISQLLNRASDNVDKEIIISGKVKHVCQHSGKRCFISDIDGNTIKIEATGDIKAFNKEIIGMTIKVVGILKEQRISKEQIDQIAKDQKLKEKEGHCSTESDNIIKMRNWMKRNGKDYYAFYYINGKEYDIIN